MQTPSTVTEWRERIGELEREASGADHALVEKRGQRRMTAGAALVFGGDTDVTVALEVEERELERRADSLRAAIELSQAELKKLQDAEHRAKVEAQRTRRATVADNIRQRAAAVDALFEQAAEHLQAIEDLLNEYRLAGGAFHRSLKGCTTRAALATGMRPYIETAFVGGHEHLRPLAEQLAALGTMPGADERLADRAQGA
jgi:DNA repair exonuclease SbcCD ATPase subunit